jgi:hypothetical protein
MKYIYMILVCIASSSCDLRDADEKESRKNVVSDKEKVEAASESIGSDNELKVNEYIEYLNKVVANDYGTTPLMKAASAGDILTVKKLIKEGCDLDEKDNKGMTVINRLRGTISRSPENLENTGQMLRSWGMRGEAVEKLIRNSRTNLSEEEFDKINEVLEYLISINNSGS